MCQSLRGLVLSGADDLRLLLWGSSHDELAAHSAITRDAAAIIFRDGLGLGEGFLRYRYQSIGVVKHYMWVRGAKPRVSSFL